MFSIKDVNHTIIKKDDKLIKFMIYAAQFAATIIYARALSLSIKQVHLSQSILCSGENFERDIS